ncbi:MAG: FAD-dependent oxidoreductase [Cyanobacteria bacterium P01_F01_bin.150]
MSRSSLLDFFRRAAAMSRMSRKSGIRLDELVGELEDRRRQQQFNISRRSLLKGGLAATGFASATLLHKGQMPAIAQEVDASPVLVVGAGIAGLTAAYRLQQAGVAADVVEARNRVGGRIHSRENALGTGYTIELGGEWIDTGHTAIRGLIEELEFELTDLKPLEANLIPKTFFFEGRHISSQEILRDFGSVAQKVDADYASIEDYEDYTQEHPAATALDRLSISEYLEQIPTSSAVRKLLETSYTTFYGLDAEEQPSLHLIYTLGTTTDELSLYGESDERFYLRGGNAQIPRRLANRLKRPVELETILEAVSETGDGRYRVSLRSGQCSQERVYDHVLITLPMPVLRNVDFKLEMPPVKRLGIETMGWGTNNKMITAYQEKVWRNRHNSTGESYSDLGYQETRECSVTRGQEGTSLFLNYLGGKHGLEFEFTPSKQAVEQTTEQVDRVYPGFKQAQISQQVVRSGWRGDRFSRGSYSCYKVGQFTQLYGSEGERVGNIFFAGEHTSAEYQGYMNGGCETGERAAQEILQTMKLFS